MKEIKKIGVLTGGGDCPGLNAVIRAVTKAAIIENGWEVIGFKDGFKGMVENSYIRLLDVEHQEKEICRFNLRENGSTATSVIFAELYRQGSEWQFKAVGEGKIADLNGLLRLYI